MPALSAPSVTVSESDGTAEFTVELDQAVQGGFTLGYTIAGVSADSPADFTPTSGSLSFAGTVGETQTISVTVVDDGVVELPETFTVSLGALSNMTEADPADVTVDGTAATGTINDDDSATVSITTPSVTVSESAGTATFAVELDQAVQGGLRLATP